MGNEVTSREIRKGLHRVAFTDDDGKLFAYHLLESERGLILFDTGMHDTPEAHIFPYLSRIGHSPADLVLVVITHADADHAGGNAAIRDACPGVLLAAHEADAPLIASEETMMSERYDQFTDVGVQYPSEIRSLLREMMDLGEPVDLMLVGGESISWRNGTFQIWHAPGHSRGSIVAYDPEVDVMIGGDAVYRKGTETVDGEVIQPPPYEHLPAYRRTIENIRETNPSLLLMSHYRPMEGEEVTAFLSGAFRWTENFDQVLTGVLRSADQPLSVPDLIDRVVDREGSYGMDLDLAYPITSHLREMPVRNVSTEEDDVPRFVLSDSPAEPEQP